VLDSKPWARFAANALPLSNLRNGSSRILTPARFRRWRIEIKIKSLWAFAVPDVQWTFWRGLLSLHDKFRPDLVQVSHQCVGTD
jgi:hypothetical protein